MRPLVIFGTLLVSLNAVAETPAGRLWTELSAKREALSSLHQEFEVSQTARKGSASQSSRRQIIIDISQGQWRERSVTGSGNRIRIFDGKDLFSMDEGGTEFVRTKRRSKEEEPVPFPYRVSSPDWGRAVELERRPCGIPGSDHLCTLLEIPLNPWARGSPASLIKRLEGSERILVDVETGMLLSLRAVEVFENPRGNYQSDVTYMLKRMSYGKPADASLFKLPS